MIVKAEFSHKGGREFIEAHFPDLLQEIKDAVEAIDIERHKTKVTKETGKRFTPGQMLYNPRTMNADLSERLGQIGWKPTRVAMRSPSNSQHAGYREMDGIKGKLGLEVQFGKYAFVLYDILGKMPIFAKRGLITAGVELVPLKELVMEMSSGVSYFEQVTADLAERGAADLDIPTLVLGIGFKEKPSGLFTADPDPTGLQGGEEDLGE